VSSGVFSFLEKIPGERITLAANQEYAWAENGVIPQGYIYADVPDANVLLERLLAGELNYSEDHPATSFQTVRETDTLRTVEFPSLSWSYIGLNLADPENPANAFDENGDPIDQGHHPLFGDVRVRRAFQNAINVEEIIDAALDGEGSVMASYDVPTSWALDPDLAPVPYDPDAARALLDEAGFTDEDGDGVRECNGCEFAEEGTPLSFELFSDDDDTSSRIGVLVQERLAEVGMEVDFAQYDFNTAIDNIVSQTFDAYILGWSGGYPADPDWRNQFTPAGDELEFGFADTSYNNPEVTQLFEEARNVAGGALEDRAEIYHEIQRILQEDQPYIWLYASNEQYAISTEFENAEVLPFQPFYNVQDWSRSG